MRACAPWRRADTVLGLIEDKPNGSPIFEVNFILTNFVTVINFLCSSNIGQGIFLLGNILLSIFNLKTNETAACHRVVGDGIEPETLDFSFLFTTIFTTVQ